VAPWAALFLSLALLAPAPLRAEQVVLKAARLAEVGKGRAVTPGIIVVDGETIAAVNPDRPPAGARVIDLGDRTLLPGLMDMHTHLTLDISGDWVHRPVKETAADAALRGARNARLTLQAGFTTVRDVWAIGFSDVSLMKAIDAGLVEGPRIIPSGHGLSITGGHCEITGFAPGILEWGPKEGAADGVDEVLKAVRYQIKHGAKVIKICATAGVLSFEGPVGAQQYSREEMDAIVAEAARHGVKVAAHAHGKEGILAATLAGVASIEHGSELTDEIFRAMKEKGTYLVPTTYLADAIDPETLPHGPKEKAQYMLPIAKESLRRAIRAGVPIAFGTDAGVFPHGDNAKEFAVLVARGMAPADAIRSATLNAADLLGGGDRGDLKPGLLADIIAVPGDPYERIEALEKVDFVMKGGHVYRQPPEGASK
jgi:imidazolonepropionase-like amidohydrolase